MILLREDNDGAVIELALCADEENAREWMRRNRLNAMWHRDLNCWTDSFSRITMQPIQVIDYAHQKPFIVSVYCTESFEIEVMANSETDAIERVAGGSLTISQQVVEQGAKIQRIEWFVQSAQAKEEVT